MKIDAFNRDVEGVFNQRNNDDQWHFIVFMSYKFKEAEKWWNTHDKELYAIILRFKNWRYYLQSNKHFIRVITDHNNFRYFMSTKKFNAKQIRWTEKLAAFNFIIKYRRKKLNFADAPSRRSDIIKFDDSENNNDDFLFILRNKFCNLKCQSKQVQIRDEFANIKLTALTAQLNDTIIADIWITRSNEKMLVRRRDILNFASFRLFVQRIAKSKRFYLNLKKSMIAWLRQLQQKNAFVAKKQWRQRYVIKKIKLSKWSMSENELLRRSLAVYVSNDSVTKKEIFRIHHDDFFSDHFARVWIENAIRKKYFWSNMLSEIDEYVRTCSDCQRVRVHHYKLYDELNLISSSGENSFHTIIMNFIIDMSSTRNSYIDKINDAILILMNKLTKHATYIATIKNLNAKNFAELLWREFISHHDMMRDIISNRNSLFTSHF